MRPFFSLSLFWNASFTVVAQWSSIWETGGAVNLLADCCLTLFFFGITKLEFFWCSYETALQPCMWRLLCYIPIYSCTLLWSWHASDVWISQVHSSLTAFLILVLFESHKSLRKHKRFHIALISFVFLLLIFYCLVLFLSLEIMFFVTLFPLLILNTLMSRGSAWTTLQ